MNRLLRMLGHLTGTARYHKIHNEMIADELRWDALFTAQSNSEGDTVTHA